MTHFDDGLTRDESGKRTDKTGIRDLTLNNWHRRYLSNKCCATDIDFYEYRFVDGIISPKALLETKQAHVTQAKYVASANSKAMFKLARAAKIKFLIVLYELVNAGTLECKFCVWEVKDANDLLDYKDADFSRLFKPYTNKEFVDLIERL